MSMNETASAMEATGYSGTAGLFSFYLGMSLHFSSKLFRNDSL